MDDQCDSDHIVTHRRPLLQRELSAATVTVDALAAAGFEKTGRESVVLLCNERWSRSSMKRAAAAPSRREL